MRSALVVSEMALSLLLLAGAGLLIKTFSALRHTDAGFSPGHVLTMEIQVSGDESEGNENRTVHFFDELSARVTALPGARSAGASTTLPLGVGTGWGKFVSVQGEPSPPSLDQVPTARFQLSTPGYLDAIGARLKNGRFFAAHDDQQGAQVAIVNESLARRFLPNDGPVGKSIRMLPPLELLPKDAFARARLLRRGRLSA